MKKENKQPLEILIHIGFWSLLYLWPFLSFETVSHNKYLIHRNWLLISSLLIVFYSNYLLLIDRYFLKEAKFSFYIINVFLILGIFYFEQVILEFNLFNPSHDGVRLREVQTGANSSLQLVLPLILGVGMSIGLKINKERRNNELALQKAKQSQLDAEINYLKYQVQPHFLFNTLNNIYALIDSSPKNAKTSIHTLSKMMRYVLHETTKEKVPLAKEIEFLNRYLELMQLRSANNLIIKKQFPIINQALHVAPLLLITFVENAFKHGINALGKSEIILNLSIEKNVLNYSVINTSYPDKSENTLSGIGLKNLEKRLNLLYPQNYELLTTEENNMFTSKLKLNL